MNLPNEFEQRMQDMLGEAYPAFITSYEKEKFQALRINTLKGDRDDFLQKSLFVKRQVPWENNGFYYGSEATPGKHPYHEAGVYYIQEPSAMAPASYLQAKPGEKILDLCAAPGGKSTQIASYMKQEGLLVCNEIHPARAKILSENVERMGIRNALVTNETPQKLSSIFDSFFDRILVDAPCSGEGMFRKNEEACDEWSLENVRICAQRQDEILDHADHMLKPGGRLVYSTCTFAPAENEGTIARFLTRHPEYKVEKVELYEGMKSGEPEWCQRFQYEETDYDMTYMSEEIRKTVRLWPQHLDGEGHYMAVLTKGGEVPEGYEGFLTYGYEQGKSLTEWNRQEDKKKGKKGKPEKTAAQNLTVLEEFLSETVKTDIFAVPNGGIIFFGDQLYLIPKDMPSLHGLKIMRPGLHLGTIKKDRFEPSHALALTLKREDVMHMMEVGTEDGRAQAFINGQTLNHEGDKGWYLICADGYSLGWGKLAAGIMKNHYPKGLRK